MEALVILILFSIVVFVVFRAISSSSKRNNGGKLKIFKESGLEPDFVFEGRLYVSLREASNAGGDFGIKFGLAIYRNKKFIRVVLFKNKRVFDILFREISNLRRVTDPAGVYGTYPLHVIVFDVDSEQFPHSQIIAYPGNWEIYDQLKAALT